MHHNSDRNILFSQNIRTNVQAAGLFEPDARHGQTSWRCSKASPSLGLGVVGTGSREIKHASLAIIDA